MRRAFIVSLWIGVTLSVAATAEVKPNRLFSDNMVLQQGMAVPVWGTAAPGEKVTVEFAGQSQSATADPNGRWKVTLSALPASSEPQTMTIAGSQPANQKSQIANVLVGEVWICSGQSNMERQLGLRPPQKPIANWEQEVAEANYPLIRHFLVARKVSDTPVTDVSGAWEVCSPKTVSQFTAVGYFFGRDLHKAIKAPIGLIHSSVGGTPAEAWTSRPALEADPELRGLIAEYEQAIKDYPAKRQQYTLDIPTLQEKYNADAEQAKKEGKPLPRRPSPPADPSKAAGHSCGLYNAMVVPLQPYAMRGVIWYQGESNNDRARQYRTLFPKMIADWRTAWDQGEFSFLFVQIAPHYQMTPEIREAQLLSWQKTRNTAMVVLTDCGDPCDIHPPLKQPVGDRLALAARAIAYGEKIEYSGPVFESMKTEGDRAILTFTHVGTGLEAKAGSLKGFTLAGQDKVFVPAQAEIRDNSIVVSSPQVTKPTAVRYGWANVPEGNLYNKEGLPASPFRTDVE
jgi:sialate O-acetylesterase